MPLVLSSNNHFLNNAMKVVSTDQMRQLDRETIDGSKIPGQTLMDRAGFGVAHIV